MTMNHCISKNESTTGRFRSRTGNLTHLLALTSALLMNSLLAKVMLLLVRRASFPASMVCVAPNRTLTPSTHVLLL
jgi:hypothetical protein